MEKKTIKDEEGKEHEVYDAIQVEAALKEKETAFATDKTKLETDLKEKDEALKKANEKDADFKAVREAKEAAEKALKEANEKYQKEITDLKGSNIKEHKDKLLGLIVGNDKNVEEKMKHHLENTLKAMPESTKEEIDAKLKAAYKLTSGTADEDKISNIISSAGGGDLGVGKVEVKPELKSIGAKFGLNDKGWENAKKAGII
jgi:hypothetical protein